MPYSVPRASFVERSMLDHAIAASGRTYRYHTGPPPLVPFGFGLSYSSFALSIETEVRGARGRRRRRLRTDGTSDDLVVTISLRNLGPLPGDAVVQAYARAGAGVALEPKPHRSLFDFQRVRAVAVGATATITFAVNARSLLLVTSNGDRVAAPGEYALSFELGDGATSVAMEVKLVGPQAVVEAWPGS